MDLLFGRRYCRGQYLSSHWNALSSRLLRYVIRGLFHINGLLFHIFNHQRKRQCFDVVLPINFKACSKIFLVTKQSRKIQSETNNISMKACFFHLGSLFTAKHTKLFFFDNSYSISIIHLKLVHEKSQNSLVK